MPEVRGGSSPGGAGASLPLVLFAWLALQPVAGARAQTTRSALPPADDLLKDPAGLAVVPAVAVRDFRFEGNTVFSDAELRAAVAAYRGRTVSFEELEEARQALTRLYVNAGYINSGAVLPDQTVDEGVVTFRIVEGRVTRIELRGQKTPDAGRRGPATAPVPVALRPRFERYLRDRIELGARQPLNVERLRDRLELVRQDPLVERVNAELVPGAAAGEAAIEATVEAARPYQVGLQFSNRRPPSVGAERFELLASHASLTGYGDALSLRYGVTKGGWDDMEFAGLDDFGVDYSVPVNRHDTTVIASVSRTDEPVIEEPFLDLDIESETESYGLTLRHPLYRTPRTEFAAAAGLDYRQNRTTLLGERFSFSPGAEDGESRVAALRLRQEFFTRDRRAAVAARSTFSIGLDAFGATDNDVADGQFLAWLGQLQYVRRLGESDWRMVARGTLQLANDSLLSLEQFSVGGVDTVRGYRENQVVRDNGAVGSLELHVPLVKRGYGGEGVLELIPFADVGRGWNVHDLAGVDSGGETLSSLGVGLGFYPNERLSLHVYYGYALNDVDVGDDDDDLQDHGIHFNVSFLMFD